MSTPPPPLPPAVATTPATPPKSSLPLVLIIVGAVVLVGIIGIAAVAGIAAPQILRMKKKGDQVRAMNNGKMLMLALNDFSAEYGSFPDRATAKAVARNTGTNLDLSGDTANDYFRQLIAAGLVRNEDAFFAKTPYSPDRPDGNIIGAAALQAGEVGFGYIMNGNKSLSSDNPNQVIAATPLFNAQTNGQFDRHPLDGKAALVHLDSSVKLATIRKDRTVEVGNGKTLLDAGANTIWGTDTTPVIKAPAKRPGTR